MKNATSGAVLLFFLFVLPYCAAAQGPGLVVGPGRSGSRTNFQVGFGFDLPMRDKDIAYSSSDWLGYGGEISYLWHAPRGSVLVSGGAVWIPCCFRNKSWPKLSGGGVVAPFLESGFRPGFYLGVGIAGGDSSFTGLEFRDYLFRFDGHYDHYYMLRWTFFGTQ